MRLTLLCRGSKIPHLALVVFLLAACAPASTMGPSPSPASTNDDRATAGPAPVLATVTLAATPGPAASDPVALPAVEATALTGDLLQVGNSIVFPITEAMINRFKQAGFPGTITTSVTGTSVGFEHLCTGRADLADASRAMRDDELTACRAGGHEPLAFRIGTDAVAVLVSNENDFVQGLTTEQLTRIFSGAVTRWRELDPAWPDEEINIAAHSPSQCSPDSWGHHTVPSMASASSVPARTSAPLSSASSSSEPTWS